MVQDDAWSCGHRAVLAAREVIRMHDSDWPPAFSTGAVTASAVHELCRVTQALILSHSVAFCLRPCLIQVLHEGQSLAECPNDEAY